MRRLFVILAIVAQISVLAVMVFGRESVIAEGVRIYLRTAPLDPRDPFRGDYVRLRYAMNNASGISVDWQPKDYQPKRGDRVYAVLERPIDGHPGAIHTVSHLTNRKPAQGLFIRGRIENGNFQRLNGWNRRTQIAAKFGIEQMYVQQGEGLEIEKKQGLRGGVQVPMEVEVALGANGVAVLTDYRWTDLGTELQFIGAAQNVSENAGDNALQQQEAQSNNAGISAEVDQSSVTNTGAGEVESGAVSVIVFSLVNVSDHAVVLNNPGDNCGFRIVAAFDQDKSLRAASQACQAEFDPELLILEPGQRFSLNIDLESPRWFVENQGTEAGSIRTVANDAFFRIVYQAPYFTGSASTEHLWQGSLPSRAFSESGRID